MINNIVIWYIENTINTLELITIHIYCEKECAYDIIISYGEDPLFMFPDNNYNKYLIGNDQNKFRLSVFEYLSIYDELKIV